MRLVMTLVGRGDADILDAQVAFHLNAGVDLVLATCHESEESAAGVLERYADRDRLRLIRDQGPVQPGEWRTNMARLAATEFAADWLISCDENEFWWPRGSSLKDILAPIPARYTAVQALVRSFVPRPDDRGFFADRLTIRRAALVRVEDAGPRRASLRPLHRARPDIRLDARGEHAAYSWLVPMRGWYPIEVLLAPSASAGAVDDSEVERGLADGSLVVDSRLRDVLRALRLPDSDGRFSLPAENGSRFDFPVPNVVDDAAYAVECAALGEADLDVLEQRIEQLETQIENLERRLWRRVAARAGRLGRRPRRDRPA